jgi:type VI secretion system secreted protein VgrG
LATLTTDCKVFQDQTPVEVIEAVLADYGFAADKRLIETYPQRDYAVQYNETDFEFVSRLMQEWGINYHFEHSAGVHRLVWGDHNGAFQVTQQDAGKGEGSKGSAYHQIPFYPLGHKIDREYIHGFSVVDSLTSGNYATREYDYTRPRASLDSGAQAPRTTGHADQEVYLWRGDKAGGVGNAAGGVGGSDYSQPNRGANKAANQTEDQGRHLARLRMQTLRQPGNRAKGVGHVRGIVPGCTFTLSEHPQERANAEYIVLNTQFVIENVSEDTQRNVVNALTDAQLLSGQWRVEVQFEVQPTTEALRPVASQRKPKTGGPETALVVGPGADTAESNIYTDSLGRIKVQFPWDRYGQKNQNSSCWVRVSSTWAGSQLGAMHLPRIGEEVIVEFLGGDPDLPLACGRVYNQVNLPSWSLPEQQALSGFRSRELIPGGGNSAAGRSNHLILDDTDQRIQVQLKSDHQHSQLSLGHITRIEDIAGRKDARGEGFELRTDGHGVIRAKDGMLISTEARSNAQAHAKDMGETTARLAQAHGQHETLGDLAKQHQAQSATDQGDVAKAIQAQNDAVQGKAAQGTFAELAEPHITLASPAGIETTTPVNTHQHSGQHHAITSGGHTSVSSNQSFLAVAKDAVRMFAYKSGMKLISASSDVNITALKTSIHLLAKMDITLTSTTIALTAKKQVLVNGAGSYMKWTAGSIEEGTAGTRVAHAATHPVAGPKNEPPKPTVWPDVKGDDRFQVFYPDGSPVVGAKFRATLESGEVISGVTDAQGQTQLLKSALIGRYTVDVFPVAA